MIFLFFSLFYAETSFVILLKVKALSKSCQQAFLCCHDCGCDDAFQSKNDEKGIIIAINERLGNGLE